MQNLLQLARHTIRAELPDFEVLQAFRAFNLCDRSPSEINPSLRTIATLLEIPFQDLQREVDDFWPRAVAYAAEGQPTHVAWKSAIDSVRKSGSDFQRLAHPSGHLRRALARFIAWNANTAPIERGFALALSSADPCRGYVSESRLDDEVLLLPRDALVPDLELCAAARRLWCGTIGPPHEQHKMRMDKGKLKRKMPLSERAFNETAFKMRRRGAVASSAFAAGLDPKVCATPAPRTVGEQGWEESHEKEVVFQFRKRTDRYLEALDAGAVATKDAIPQDHRVVYAEAKMLEALASQFPDITLATVLARW